jgi:hypothetical protein
VRPESPILAELQSLVEPRRSRGALVFSILPLAVHYIGAKPTATWAISSGLLAGWTVIMPLIDALRWRRSGAFVDARFQMWLVALALLFASVAAVTQALNAFGIGFHRTFGPYLLGLCCLLMVCLLFFVRLLSFVGHQFAEE